MTDYDPTQPCQWWVIDYEYPQNHSEPDVSGILAKYPSERMTILREDEFSTVALWRVEPYCSQPPESSAAN